MLTHGNLLSVIANIKVVEKLKIFSTDVHLSYLPLAHIFEKIL